MFYFLFLVLLLAPQESLDSEPIPDDPALNWQLEREDLSTSFFIPETLSQTASIPAVETKPMFTGQRFWGNVIGIPQQETETSESVKPSAQSTNFAYKTEVLTLSGHTGPVEIIAFTSDFLRILSAGSDRQIILWNPLTGEPIRKYRGSRTTIASLAVSKNGKNFVSCTSTDRRVLFWNIDAETPEEEFPTPPWEPSAVAINSDATCIVVGLVDGQTIFYRKSMDSPAFQVATFKGHLQTINHIRFSHDEKRFLTCGNDRAVVVWDAMTRKPIQTFRNKHRGAVLCADFSPDGKEIVSAGADKTAFVWTITDGEIKYRLPGHVGDITAVAFSADGSEIFTAARDRTIVLWDAKTGEKKAVAPIRNSPILSADWNEINKSVAIGCTNGTVEILASSVFIPEKNGMSDSGSLLSVSYSHSSRLSDADKQKRQALMELPSGQIIFRYGKTHYSDIGTVSPNGLHLVSINTNRGEGTLWETNTGKVGRLLDSPQQISVTRFHTKDPNFLLAGLKNGDIRYWNLSQNHTSDFPGHESPVQAIDVAPDGTQFLSGAADGTIILWNILAKQKLQTLQPNKKKIRSLAFSPDGKHFAVGTEDSVLRLWTIGNGEGNPGTEQKLTGHDTGDISVVFSPNGVYLYSAASDGKAIQWEVTTGRLMKEFKAHTDAIVSMAISPNGQYLLTGGKSEEFSLLWDVHTAEPVMIFPRQGGPVTDVLFHPLRFDVITVGGRTPLLWNISGIQTRR